VKVPKDATLNDKWTRYAGYLLFFAGVQFVIAMIAAQLAFPCTTNGICYSAFTNPISDLGNTMTSPLWPVFNYSLVLFGVLGFSSLLILRLKFPDGVLRDLGLLVILIGILGAVGVGVVPENTILAIHSIFALIAFVGLALGILIFGIGIRKRKEWSRYGTMSIMLGTISLLAIIIFMLPSFGILPHWIISGPGIGFGAIERLVMVPSLVWVLMTGWIFSFRRSN
jgi:hypothetical membrane protein